MLQELALWEVDLSDGALVGPVLGVQAHVSHEEEVLAESLATQAALGGLHPLLEALVLDQSGVLAVCSGPLVLRQAQALAEGTPA